MVAFDPAFHWLLFRVYSTEFIAVLAWFRLLDYAVAHLAVGEEEVIIICHLFC